jgi:predicted metalloprotease with PDZ domain
MKTLRQFFMASMLLGLSMFSHADVNYKIKITNATQHLAEVQVEFPKVREQVLDVQLPVWRAGRYDVLNFGKNIRQFSATSGAGTHLKFTKTDKGTWQVRTIPGESVLVKYEMYANALGDRTHHIDDTHAYLNASGVMMYAAPFRQHKVSVQLDVPPTWKSRSGMEKSQCDHCFVAPNYDTLIDSPIETGEHEFYSFEYDARSFELVIWGRGNHDGKKIAADLKKIVAETKKTMGDWPFKKRYLFIIHATDGLSGATEHINSTVITRKRWNFIDRRDYLGLLSTSAHEFVHTWNVKAYRAKEMSPYHFQSENYNHLLWISEGHTSYFNDLILLRAGLMMREEFFDNRAKDLLAYQHQPGRFYQSAAESSFDAWIDQNGSERAKNASVNIYTKGRLLALMMDIALRDQTKGEKGLEHLHQYLYAHHRVEQGGFSAEDVRRGLKVVSGHDWNTWWTDYVDGMHELPLTAMYQSIGMYIVIEPGKDALQKEEYFTGLKFRETSDDVLITEVERDSPAWHAGLVAGDTIAAVNGLRVFARDVNEKLWLFQKLPLKLHVFRREELREMALTPLRQAKGKAKLNTVANLSSDQKMLNEQWLGIAWSSTNK